METILIDKIIDVPPSKLSCGLYEYLLEAARALCKPCTKQYGYLVEILELTSWKNNRVIHSDMTTFMVTIKMNVLKPAIGRVFPDCKITMAMRYGIMCTCMDRLHVLIPKKKLIDYKFEDNSFISPKGVILTVGSSVNVEIVEFKFTGPGFNCIGMLTDRKTNAKKPRIFYLSKHETDSKHDDDVEEETTIIDEDVVQEGDENGEEDERKDDEEEEDEDEDDDGGSDIDDIPDDEDDDIGDIDEEG